MELLDPTDAPTPVLEEPSVLGAGGGIAPLPTKAEAEAAWRRGYVARMVERGIHADDAQSCCDAGDVDLSTNPAAAADDQLEYWDGDGDTA